MEKWLIKNNKIDFLKIAKEMGISEIISKILVNREISDIASIDRFLNSDINRLYSPNLMRDLIKGGDILKVKIENKLPIRIVGDFDVDGVISVFILYEFLKKLGAVVDYVIPDRVNDGYGINNDIVKKAKKDGIDTIITCDNGIAALNQVELAKELDLTVIITDHHDLPFLEENGERRYLHPKADAIINPKHPQCQYPFKHLCGAGVVFKLIEYLGKEYNISKEYIYGLLEYVAIATICDVVDLVDENRIMVKHGLELINSTDNIGLRALIEESKLKKTIGVYHIGFVIGPIINASGRLDTAYAALELLLSKDIHEAKSMASELRQLNEERKQLTQEGIDNIMEKVESTSLKNNKILVVYEPNIHESVAGIIAGRIKDTYYKPTIVLTQGQEGVKGSARSIEEYNIFEELTKCKDLLGRFGGHPMAAGLSLGEENIESLRDRLNTITSLTEEDLIKKVYIDMGLPIEYINFKLLEELEILEPFGKGNPRPIFGERKLRIKRLFKLGANKNVIKVVLQSQKGTIIDGILFSDTNSFEEGIIEKYGREKLECLYKGIDNNVLVDIIYYPSINEYMGKVSIQVVIQNYRF